MSVRFRYTDSTLYKKMVSFFGAVKSIIFFDFNIEFLLSNLQKLQYFPSKPLLQKTPRTHKALVILRSKSHILLEI